MTAMTPADQAAFLSSLNLSPTAPGLSTGMTATEPAKAPKAGKAKKAKKAKAVEAPVAAPVVPSIDLHTVPVMEIVWDASLLDGFPDLSGSGMAAASRHLFEAYKSPGKDRDRNSLLHREIGLFIARTRRARMTGSQPVTEAVKASSQQREMAALLAEMNVTPEMLAGLLQK